MVNIGVMEQEEKIEMPCSIWIDEQSRIVSFKDVAGYREICFATREEKFAFAIEKCSSGYRIQ